MGTVQYFTLKYKDEALHRMIKMYMQICLRLLLLLPLICLFAVLAS